MTLAATATPIELAWTLVTALGLAANAWGLLDAWADQRFLRDAGLNGRRAIVARWHVVLNAGLTYVQVAFLLAGLVALTSANPSGAAGTKRALIQVAFLSAEPVLVLLAIEAHRYRARLLATRNLRTILPGVAGELEDDERSS